MLEVLKDDACVLVLLRRVAPHVKVAVLAPRLAPPGSLKPWMLVRRVRIDLIDNDLETPFMGRFGIVHHALGGAVGGDNLHLTGNLKFFADGDRSLHGGQVGVTAHDDANQRLSHRIAFY